MTFDPNDLSHMTQPRRTYMSNANGITYPVTKAGIVALSLSLSLSLSPSVSHASCSISIKQVDGCELGHRIAPLYSTNVPYFLSSSGYSQQGDHWAWF